MTARREQIKELLRSARSRISPVEIGLPHGHRRRGSGLRREDVATLAGVSLKWYSWLEQGRDVNFSAIVVQKVCQVLRLTKDETQYLFALIQKPATPVVVRENEISDALLRTIQYAPMPKLVMTSRWDIVSWNYLMRRLFRDYGTIPAEERNLLKIVLRDEKYQSDPESYDAMARTLLSEFRVDFGQCSRNPDFEQLIEELKQVDPQFEQRWRSVHVVNNSIRGSLVQHEQFGDLLFDRVSYVPEDTALRVLMFVPADTRTADIVASLRPRPSTRTVSSTIKIRTVTDATVLRHHSRN